MSKITLREVCGTCGVSRRAIQGYEKAGLVRATGKNARGYLLYDTCAQERISRIKLYQELEFSIKEIKMIIDAPNEVLKKALEEQIVYLCTEMEHKDELIRRAYELMEMC